ncbi:enoyl-CoA hydratase [Natrialba magadii ATCC 43099]|uniref:Enoyl-CoA hydratase n=1 Tax=Natrialba magadii (strain ATCC 43099 / DSM 3394 / CCM 3739 / CIP 104546 / IAM 13178 / JCM 8861 / NBRC 102185 / NCIMB 2190 / MS3) TaxID=547559 RepID=D3T037_NATMM|nr:enoyl-CoA hydratase/isomerase family protein [Natrialba magadii]ADD04395.1 enoyl-CoA hydratase [Natrialba magadii ATCC 43099]ELY25791.1 enoyl-CoA hydratase/isomerase [Natrialba magadii ATCC 43099]
MEHDTEFDTTLASFDDDTGVGHVTLNRPDSLNALNTQLREDLVGSLEWLESKNDEADGIALRAVIVEGAGGTFCAGADVTEFSDSSPGAQSGQSHYEFIAAFPAPVIAKVRGYCLGGGLETALACDFRFAHEESSFGFPEVNLGLLPGAGGVQYLAELADPSTAKELAMTGEHISAEHAAEIGLANRVYGDDLDEETQAFAEQLASQPPLAIQSIKESAAISTQTGLEEGRAYDGRLFRSLLETDDHEEGARAFAEDEYEPEFKGR